MIGIGVIGYGYWGPNIVRNFRGLANCKLIAVCDQSHRALTRLLALFANIGGNSGSRDIFTSKDINTVAIVTPVPTHYELARQCLENDKHVFVEKPFTATVSQAETLVELAEAKHLKVMVDHTFLFTGAVRKMKELIEQKILGALYYY